MRTISSTNSQKLGAAGAAIGSILFAASADAQIAPIVQTGAECELVQGTRDVDTLGVVQNKHATTDLYVSCPIKTNHSSDTVAEVVMIVDDRNSADRVDCTLTCTNWVGTAQETETQRTGIAEQSAFIGLEFAGFEVDTAAYMSCFVWCKIPNMNEGTSGIISYRTDF